VNKLSGTIRARRKELGLTLEEVAEIVGVTAGALSHVESGRRLPDARNAVAVAAALKLDPDELLTLLDEAHADRRASQIGWTMPSERISGRQRSAAPSADAVYSVMPIQAMFERSAPPKQRPSALSDPPYADMSMAAPSERSSRQHARVIPAAARDRARFSPDSTDRLHAAEELAEEALRAIRTLRGMLDDDDPAIAREARRLLRELDVRGMEE
jgi:transcriptional regulator with XRE-family HTH domain